MFISNNLIFLKKTKKMQPLSFFLHHLFINYSPMQKSTNDENNY